MLSNILIIGFIVIIFTILFVIYSDNETSRNITNANIDIDMENKTHLLELMNEAKNNAKENIKKTREKFISLTQSEANSYLNELNFLNYWLQNNSGEKGIMEQIKQLVKSANNSKIENKKVLVNILTNIYSMAYLNFINHQNAEAYKVYAKYSNPRNNKFYTQYLNS